MATTSEGYFQACDSSCRASKACAPEPSHDGDRVEKPGSFSYLPSQYSVYITRSGVKGELDNGKADLDCKERKRYEVQEGCRYQE